jgi:hypothetical protein
LGWKLALAAKGQADSALLATYEAERMPVAHRLLDSTDRAFRLVVSPNWVAGLFRTRILTKIVANAMRLQRAKGIAFGVLSQTGINYPGSPLSRNLDGMNGHAPRGGDRFPWLRVKLRADGPVEDLYGKWDDTKFTLLVFGQPAPSEIKGLAGDLVAIHSIPADSGNEAELTRAGVPLKSFYPLRPDGHVGMCGGTLESGALENYLAQWVRGSSGR